MLVAKHFLTCLTVAYVALQKRRKNQIRGAALTQLDALMDEKAALSQKEFLFLADNGQTRLLLGKSIVSIVCI